MKVAVDGGEPPTGTEGWMVETTHRGILVHRIPAEGFGGLVFALGMVALTLVAVPALRPLVALSLVAGLLFAPLVHRLHSH